MRALFKFIGFIFVFPNVLFAHEPLFTAFGLRGHETYSKQVCEQIEGCRLGSHFAKEYESGSSFAQIQEEVLNRAVLIILPPKLTPDSLMEALILTRIAQSNGASLVAVVSSTALSTLPVLDSEGAEISLPLESMFAVAGAGRLKESGGSLKQISPEVIKGINENPTQTFVAGTNHPELRDILCKLMDLPLLPQNSPASLINQSQILMVSPSTPPLNENLFKNLSQIRNFSQLGASVHFISPYLPYARSDKMDQSGTTVIGRLVADLIESVGTQSITFTRAHAPQSEGFFRIVTHHLSGLGAIVNYLKSEKVEVIVSPDAGFQKVATRIAELLNLPIAIINKARDPETGKIKIHGVSGANIRGKILGLFDDESATGGTIDEGATYLKAPEQGAKEVIGGVWHLAGSASKALQSTALTGKFVVTNTLPIDPKIRDQLIVLDIGSEIAEALANLPKQNRPLVSRCIAALNRFRFDDKTP